MARRAASVATATLIAFASAVTAQNPALDKAFEAYWRADSAGDAAKAGERLIKAGVDFDTAWARLKAGRPYKKERTGELSWRYPGPQGAVFDNAVEIPEDYDPSRPWQVRVQLHGGVNRRAQGAGSALTLDDDEPGAGGGGAGGRAPSLARRRAPNRIPGENQIYVHPGAWADAAWWHSNQVDNILRVLDRLKRHYNVDESRIYLTGISDGGTGAYYIAMREPTMWSAILPLNGSIKVLGNPDIKADGELYLSNIVNKPMYIVNGGRDPLYPVEHVQTHVAAMKQIGAALVFSPQPAAGHDTSWWRWERTPYEQFVRTRPRHAHPAAVSWETERVDRFNRVHWLVIDRLGAGPNDATLNDVEIFPRKRPSGRVDAKREGNSVTAVARGVRELTVLISPDVFDMSKPVAISVNGKQLFEGVAMRDPATLFKWAARDNDRTMLYAAEIRIQVP